MSAYGKSRLAWGIFGRIAMGSNHHLVKPLVSNASRFDSTIYHQWKMGFSGSSLVSSNLGYRGMKQTQNKASPQANVVVLGRRYYNVGNFKQTPNNATLLDETSNTNSPWTRKDALSILCAAVFGGAAMLTVDDLGEAHGGKTVPWGYKEREHGFEDYLKATHGSEAVLQATHPTRERVARIAHSVFDALRRGVEDNSVWGGRVYALGATQKSLCTDWEVFVVDDPLSHRVDCFKDGKIVVYAGALDGLKSDAEIAYLIAHKVALAVARPHVEDIAMYWGNSLIIACLMAGYARCRQRLLIVFPFVLITRLLSKVVKQTADFFGLLLTASAGYHPNDAAKTGPFSGKIPERAMAVYQKSLWSLGDRE